MTTVAVLASDIGSGLASVLLVGIGGAAGALARFVIGEWIDIDRFPVAVIVVNAVGTFLATLLALTSLRDDLLLFASVGFCGSLTTFSTFSVRTVGLWEAERRLAAASFAAGTLLASLGGAGLAVGIVSLR